MLFPQPEIPLPRPLDPCPLSPLGSHIQNASPYHDPLGKRHLSLSLCSPSSLAAKGEHSAGCGPLWYSQAHSPPLQVLCGVLLPADARHGGRLWWKGGSSEDTEGYADEDSHRPLLLLLPLLPPTHAHQVRQEGETASENTLPLPALSLERLLVPSALLHVS